VAIALQHAQLFDQNRLFSEVDELIFAAGDSQQVIQTALQKVMDALHVLEHIELSGAQIFFRRGKHELEVVHSTDPSHIGLSINVEQSICGRALREGKTVLIGDVSTEPEYRSMLGSSIQSEIAIPILLGDAAVSIGVLNVESTEPDAFEGFAQVLLENFADKVRTLLAFAKLRSDVTETMELRNASDLLVAVGDQASNMIHRMNNSVGAMRLRIIELQDLQDTGDIAANEFLTETLAALRDLADQTLEMPEEVTRLLNQQGATVNVNEIVQAVVDKARLPATITTKLDLDPTVPPLSLYSFDIVVENLVQNAIDAMPSGGTLSITTTTVLPTSVPAGYVELAISDTGAGIPPEILPKIFELNFTTKTKKGRGHGLGLWWIRNFVLRSKGDIAVNSSVGHGAEFVVKIPFEREPASEPAE
jgi:signal transduction histidine kinase